MAIDTSKPHLGRIYDFMLGGHHNYEVDRQAAAQILKVAPTYPKWARANRWFLQFVASEWEQAGRKQVLDLATGLPTKGHFNDMMPAARILFTDNDPLSVAYGGELLAGNLDMRYRLADVGNPETVVAEAEEFFGNDRVLAISCIGIAYLVPDSVLSAVLRALHTWSAPGSVLALTFGSFVDDGDRAQLEAAIEAFRRHANTSMYLRTNDELVALASPWRATAIRSLPDWLGVPDMFSREELASQGGSMSGVFFEH
jgi:hypothetical protein